MITMIRSIGNCVKWVLIGAMVGLALNYYLYRIWLPISPFVYQAF